MTGESTAEGRNRQSVDLSSWWQNSGIFVRRAKTGFLDGEIFAADCPLRQLSSTALDARQVWDGAARLMVVGRERQRFQSVQWWGRERWGA